MLHYVLSDSCSLRDEIFCVDRRVSAADDGLGRRLRAGLAAGELALALMLLVGAGLLVRSIIALNSQDAGSATSQVLALGLGSRPDAPFALRQFLGSGENRAPRDRQGDASLVAAGVAEHRVAFRAHAACARPAQIAPGYLRVP